MSIEIRVDAITDRLVDRLVGIGPARHLERRRMVQVETQTPSGMKLIISKEFPEAMALDDCVRQILEDEARKRQQLAEARHG